MKDFMKITLDSNDDLTLNKILSNSIFSIVIKSVF